MALGVFGIAQSQWERFREMMVDSSTNYQTWEEWRQGVEKALQEMRKAGIEAQIVEVDLDAFEAWCIANQKQKDGAARSQYVAELLQEKE